MESGYKKKEVEAAWKKMNIIRLQSVIELCGIELQNELVLCEYWMIMWVTGMKEIHWSGLVVHNGWMNEDQIIKQVYERKVIDQGRTTEKFKTENCWWDSEKEKWEVERTKWCMDMGKASMIGKNTQE